MFTYKNASTEWHYHPTDETLTTQLVGAKRASIFRLTAENWESYAQPLEYNFHHMSGGKSFFPPEKPVTKYEIILEAGDAVYLPPFWWHGVDTADSRFGITLAHCFRTPLRRYGDWKEPATRKMVRDMFTERKRKLPSVLSSIALSSLSRFFAGEAWMIP